MTALDLPAGTVYVPVLAGSTTPPAVSGRVKVRRIGGRRPWSVTVPARLSARPSSRTFKTFEDARLFVYALMSPQEPTC